jgi:hypothetical protein
MACYGDSFTFLLEQVTGQSLHKLKDNLNSNQSWVNFFKQMQFESSKSQNTWLPKMLFFQVRRKDGCKYVLRIQK